MTMLHPTAATAQKDNKQDNDDNKQQTAATRIASFLCRSHPLRPLYAILQESQLPSLTHTHVRARIQKSYNNNMSVIHCASETDFHAVMESAGNRLVVVDCYADWCPPCQAMVPIFDELSKEYPNVVFCKVDTERAPRIKTELGVWALPTFTFFKNGEKVGSFMGAREDLLRSGLENDGRVSICMSMCSIQ